MPVRLSVNDTGQRYGRAGVCLGGWLEEGAGVPVQLSVNDAGQRYGRAGVCLGGWLKEGAGVPVWAFLLVAQLVVVGPEAAAAEPARIRLLAYK